MGKMPLYTMLQKARSAGGWTMVAQLEGDAAGSQLLLLEGRPVWQRGGRCRCEYVRGGDGTVRIVRNRRGS